MSKILTAEEITRLCPYASQEVVDSHESLRTQVEERDKAIEALLPFAAEAMEVSSYGTYIFDAQKEPIEQKPKREYGRET